MPQAARVSRLLRGRCRRPSARTRRHPARWSPAPRPRRPSAARRRGRRRGTRPRPGHPRTRRRLRSCPPAPPAAPPPTPTAPPGPRYRAPAAPSVVTTCPPPGTSSAASAAASVSLTTRMVTAASSSGASGRLGEGLSRTGTPAAAATCAAAGHRGQRHLQLQHEQVRGGDHRRVVLVESGQRAVRAGHHHDGVLRGVVDGDQRDAGRTLDPPHPAGVDPGIGERVHQGGAELVGADRADHPDPATGPGRGDRLIGALAARRCRKACPGKGFARGRESGSADDQVHVEAAEHGDRRRRIGDRTSMSANHGPTIAGPHRALPPRALP